MVLPMDNVQWAEECDERGVKFTGSGLLMVHCSWLRVQGQLTINGSGLMVHGSLLRVN